MTSPKIIDAVVDEAGARYVKIGTEDHSVWLPIRQMLLDAKQAYYTLSTCGVTLLTRKARNSFEQTVQDHDAFRPALIASTPGWLQDRPIFVTGDGRVIAPSGLELPEIIIAFPVDAKFRPRGFHAFWSRDISKVVAGQPLPIFALGLAFAAPLLRYAPPHIVNLLAEIVGDPEKGKTILGVLASSVWAGDSASDTGGGESWDATVNRFDPIKAAHADMLAFLDEANLAEMASAGKGARTNAVFKFAATGSKKRLNQEDLPDVRTVVLSTSNKPLSEGMSGPSAVIEALRSRMPSIVVGSERHHGVLDSIPSGFESAADAMRYLRAACDDNYGKAGPRFVRRLAAAAHRDEAGLRAEIARLIERYRSLSSERGTASASARHADTLAMAYTALSLAIRTKVLPRSVGSPAEMVLSVEQMVGPTNNPPHAQSDMKRIKKYRRDVRGELISVEALKRPLPREEFESSAGFLRRCGDQTEIFIPSRRFQAVFPDYVALMGRLRSKGIARTEAGNKPKLTIKTPRQICDSGRVYCITV